MILLPRLLARSLQSLGGLFLSRLYRTSSLLLAWTIFTMFLPRSFPDLSRSWSRLDMLFSRLLLIRSFFFPWILLPWPLCSSWHSFVIFMSKVLKFAFRWMFKRLHCIYALRHRFCVSGTHIAIILHLAIFYAPTSRTSIRAFLSLMFGHALRNITTIIKSSTTLATVLLVPAIEIAVSLPSNRMVTDSVTFS